MPRLLPYLTLAGCPTRCSKRYVLERFTAANSGTPGPTLPCNWGSRQRRSVVGGRLTPPAAATLCLAVEPGRPIGSRRTLSDEQGRWILDLIDGHGPEDPGVHTPLWSRRAVRSLIRRKYAIAMPARTVGEYLKRWAARPRRLAVTEGGASGRRASGRGRERRDPRVR